MLIVWTSLKDVKSRTHYYLYVHNYWIMFARGWEKKSRILIRTDITFITRT